MKELYARDVVLPGRFRTRTSDGVLSGAEGARVDALPGDQPATIYLSISKDRQSAWLTALTGGPAVLRLPSGRPAVVEAQPVDAQRQVHVFAQRVGVEPADREHDVAAV